MHVLDITFWLQKSNHYSLQLWFILMIPTSSSLTSWKWGFGGMLTKKLAWINTAKLGFIKYVRSFTWNIVIKIFSWHMQRPSKFWWRHKKPLYIVGKERWACSRVANSLKNSQFPFSKITNLLELIGRFVEERNRNLEKTSREVKVKSEGHS